jgi:hypothetical protein
MTFTNFGVRSADTLEGAGLARGGFAAVWPLPPRARRPSGRVEATESPSDGRAATERGVLAPRRIAVFRSQASGGGQQQRPGLGDGQGVAPSRRSRVAARLQTPPTRRAGPPRTGGTAPNPA